MTATLLPPTPSAPRERRAPRGLRGGLRVPGRGRAGWSALVLLVALLVAAPVVAVLVVVATDDLPPLPGDAVEMVVTTVLLLLAVGVGTSVVGVGLAWLVTAFDFPGRGVLVWLLVLPLAMPAYILSFTTLSTLGAAGPLQGALRSVLGDGVEVPVRSLVGCALVMTFALYPYVYLLARAAFVEQGAATYDAARSLGATRGRAFREVLLPLARPSIAAGLALVMMEVLTDFATVQYFGVKTVTVGVYRAWRDTNDVAAASQLASMVLMFAVVVLAGERLLRGRARFTQRGGRSTGLTPERLHGGRAAAAAVACLLALVAGFFAPVLRLGTWAVQHLAGGGEVDPRFGDYLVNSVVVAALTAVVCVGIAVLVGHAVRLGGGRLVRAAAQASTFGYAVPGAVVGIGTLVAFAGLDAGLEALGVPGGTGLLVTGSVIGILFAYGVRFLGPAHQAVDASYAKLAPTMTLSALSLGASPRRILARVHLPLVRPGVAVGLVLVTIDAIKELPVVLLLRPFGFTTVSVWVYQLAAESFWTTAALPALLIVALATVPVALLFRQVRREDRARRVPAVRSGGR